LKWFYNLLSEKCLLSNRVFCHKNKHRLSIYLSIYLYIWVVYKHSKSYAYMAEYVNMKLWSLFSSYTVPSYLNIFLMQTWFYGKKALNCILNVCVT
jgi:hypothetical protein